MACTTTRGRLFEKTVHEWNRSVRGSAIVITERLKNVPITDNSRLNHLD